LIFYADKIMVMCNSKNSRVFNFAILLKSRNHENLKLMKYTRFTVMKIMAKLVYWNSQ